jgi:HEAT repeat protein
LKNIGTPAIEPIIKLLRDNIVWGKAGDAIAVLVKIGTPAEEPLIEILKDEQEYMRQTAALMQGRIGDNRAVEPLIDALEDEDPVVCSSAADALDKLGWRANETECGARYWTAKDLYAQSTGSENVRQNGADALKEIKWHPDKSTAGAAYWIARNEWDKCAEIGVPAVKSLFITLQNSDRIIQQAAANVLMKIGELAADNLITLLNEYFKWSFTDSGSLVLRINAAKVLGKIGDPRAIKVLINMGAKVERTTDHRGAAAEALGIIEEPAIEPLISILQKDDANLQQLATWGLGKLAILVLWNHSFQFSRPNLFIIPMLDQRQGKH